MGTLHVSYSQTRKVEAGIENETWKKCFKVLVSLITGLYYKFDEYEKEDSALMFVVFLGWSFCTETYGRSVDG